VNKPPQPADARSRLPREPYPGLRPFLDFEAALLFGRERQVREVIEHLRTTQFVAVLGGSGSGKSSLIHAGVVPHLRSHGIPDAGDLWLPMTCTPGTNVSAADSLARKHTPITRLARRFAALLKSRGSEDADRQRLADIAEVFRQEAGFARLVDTYGSELNLAPGPDPEDARVLFVLDQFEELFHPTNQGVADVSLLVERVLDHFFNPHPRCHVVITMRSEHLNDCATYLELPDAINKSSYLIRRLDTAELLEAITGPAQRFLRLVARNNPSPALPEQVVFEDRVVQRVLCDTQALTHDPDHLPLMQHLLARLWEAALEREEMEVQVPARITWADLVRAVLAQRATAALDDKLNTLRACVENWPETIYQWHDTAQRAQLDALFAQLAFKDPNTGLYSQQRLDVDKGAQCLGPGATRSQLRALIAEGFLGSVDYLFWDAEDPARVTLKVSHESFIRGWARFRALIDQESARFSEFLAVLRKCADWSLARQSEDFLLEAGELRRLHDSGFALRLRQADQRDNWRRFLALDRDGQRLAQHEAALDRFFNISRQREEDRRARETRAKRSAYWAAVFTVAVVLLPTAVFSWLVQGPTMRRAENLFDAGNRANRAAVGGSQAKVGDGGGTLDSMLRAAEQVEAARVGEGSRRLALSRELLDTFGGLPFFKDQRDFLGHVFSQAEPPVNSTLRGVLTSAVWLDARLPEDSELRMTAPTLREGAVCTGASAASGTVATTGGGAEQTDARGRLFVSASRRAAEDGRALRALFVPDRFDFDRKLEVFSASVNPVDGQCSLGTLVLESPEALDSRVLFDASLRYFYYTVQGAATPIHSVIVQEVDWERGGDGQVRAVQRQTLATITDPGAVASVLALLKDQRAAAVPTWRVLGGRQVQIGPRAWRIVSAQAQRVDLPVGAPQARALQASAPGSPCITLASAFATMPGFESTHLETASHCFMVARGWPELGPGDGPRQARDELRVAVHDKLTGALLERARLSPPAPVAGLVPFARLAAEDVATDAGLWFVGTAGPYEGWLLFKVSGAGERFVGAPWSSCALWRLGRDVQRDNPAPGELQSGESKACELKN
jgi:hypothetical protein